MMSTLSVPLPAATDPTLVDAAAQRLAQARATCGRARTHLADLETAFWQQPDVLVASETLAAAQAEQQAADQELRTLLLDLHQATGQTKFGVTGEVRIVQSPVYLVDELALIEEIAAHMPDLIVRQVDRRRLEKRLRNEPQAQIPGVVELVQEPKVFLSTKLGSL